MKSSGKLIKKPEGVVVVEVQAPRQVTPMTKDIAASVATLQGHPGFQWLLARLRLQGSLLKSTLNNQRQKDMKDVEFLQSGIAWTGWLETQLMKALGYTEPVAPQAPYQSERDAFDEVSKFIEVLK